MLVLKHIFCSFQVRLAEIFLSLHDCYQSIEGRLKAEQFKQKVMSVFRAWEDWAIYAGEYLGNLQNIFLGLVPKVAFVLCYFLAHMLT